MNPRLQTVLMWFVALIIVASCGLVALTAWQGASDQVFATITAMGREYHELSLTTTAVLGTANAMQTQAP